MAQGTTQKHEDFVDEPMGDKPVEKVPGVDKVLGKSLRDDSGIDTARKLYGMFLSDENNFKKYIEQHGGNAKSQEHACQAMNEYSEQHN